MPGVIPPSPSYFLIQSSRWTRSSPFPIGRLGSRPQDPPTPTLQYWTSKKLKSSAHTTGTLPTGTLPQPLLECPFKYSFLTGKYSVDHVIRLFCPFLLKAFLKPLHLPRIVILHIVYKYIFPADWLSALPSCLLTIVFAFIWSYALFLLEAFRGSHLLYKASYPQAYHSNIHYGNSAHRESALSRRKSAVV